MSAKKGDSNPSDQQRSKENNSIGLSKNAHLAVWQMNEPIDVDDDEPNNAESSSLPVITKVESMCDQSTKFDESVKTEEKAFMHVCNLLGLKSNQPLQNVKEELRMKKKKLSHDPNLHSNKTNSCKSIFISQMPVWFQYFHVKALIQLTSDFDAASEFYYIDMFKDFQNENTGEFLLRFMENKDCLQVYKDLQGIELSDKPMTVSLDLDHEIADARANYDPKLRERLQKFNEKRRATNKFAIGNEGSDDDVQIVEPEEAKFIKNVTIKSETIKTEVQEYSTDSEEYEITDNIKQEPVDQVTVVKTEKTNTPKNTEEQNYEQTAQVEPAKQTVEPESDAYSKCRIVHFKNLPKSGYYGIVRKQIKLLLGYDPNFKIRRVKDQNRKPNGDIILEFETHRDAENVCKTLNGYCYKGHRLQVVMGVGYEFMEEITSTDLRLFALKRKIHDIQRDKQATASNREEQQPSNREDPQPAKKSRTERSSTPNIEDYETGFLPLEERCFEAFGLSKEFIQKNDLKVPFSRTVTVSRLSIEVNEEKLLEVFSLAGEVKKIKITPDEDFRNRIRAKIEYDHPLEAVQAISMFHKQKLYNQEMYVDMEAISRKPKPLPLGLAAVGPGLANNGGPLRGLRFTAEIRLLHDMFVDLDIMERLPNNDKPIKFLYKKLKSKDRFRAERFANKFCTVCHACTCDSKSKALSKDAKSYSDQKQSNNPSSSVSASNTTYSRITLKKNSKPEQQTKPQEPEIPKGTLLAIQALGTILISQGLIPPNTDCKNLQSILAALQKKVIANRNIILVSNQQSPNLNTDTSGPNVGNPIPPNQHDSLNQAINQVLQFMPQHIAFPNVVQNLQNVTPNAVDSNNQMQPPKNICNPEIPGVSLLTPAATVKQKVTSNNPVPGNIVPHPGNGQPQSRWDVKASKGNAPANAPLLPCPAPNVLPALLPTPRGPFRPQTNNMPIYKNFNQQNQNPLQTPCYNQHQAMLRPNLIEVPHQNQPQNVQSDDQKSESQRVSAMPTSSQDIPSNTKDSVKGASQSFQKSEMLVFKNLPVCVSTEVLANKMREIGELKFCELHGKDRAFVRFQKQQDAVRCIPISGLFNRSKVDGQVIEVNFL